jgi:hypothetical protein
MLLAVGYEAEWPVGEAGCAGGAVLGAVVLLCRGILLLADSDPEMAPRPKRLPSSRPALRSTQKHFLRGTLRGSYSRGDCSRC